MSLEFGKEIASFFSEFIKLFRLSKRKKRRDAFDDSLHISEIAKAIVYNGLSIDFLFVVMIHNGGKPLRPHDFKYRSIVGGEYNEFTLKRFEWKNHRKVLIDFEYEILIRKIKKYEVIDVSNNEFDSGGKIRTAVDFENIKHKRYFFLHGDSEALWFVVAGTTAPNERLDLLSQKQALNVAVNEIRNIILKY